MAISPIVHKRCLQRRLDPCHFGKIDIPSELALKLAFKIKFFDFVPVDHNNAGFFRVCGID